MIEEKNDNILNDIRYICKSSELITNSLQKGFDVAQLPDGSLIITEIKKINVHYYWDAEKEQMVRGKNIILSVD